MVQLLEGFLSFSPPVYEFGSPAKDLSMLSLLACQCLVFSSDWGCVTASNDILYFSQYLFLHLCVAFNPSSSPCSYLCFLVKFGGMPKSCKSFDLPLYAYSISCQTEITQKFSFISCPTPRGQIHWIDYLTG